MRVFIPIFILTARLVFSQDLLDSGIAPLTDEKIDTARKELETAARNEPNNPRPCLLLTQIYSRLGQSTKRDESAKRCFELAHGRNDWQTSGAIRNYLGKLSLAQGQYDPAVREYKEAIRLEPYDEQFRFDLAQALLGHEQFRDAVAALTDAKTVFEKSAQIELSLGVAYYGERRFGDAADSFLRTIQLDPEVMQPYIFLGKMLDQIGERLPEAIEDFRALVSKHPENYVSSLLLAKALAVEGGAPEERERLLTTAARLNNSSAETHYELGVLFEGQHQYKSAEKELARSAQLEPGDAATHYHLARVYDRLGKSDLAIHEREVHRGLTSKEKVTAGMVR